MLLVVFLASQSFPPKGGLNLVSNTIGSITDISVVQSYDGHSAFNCRIRVLIRYVTRSEGSPEFAPVEPNDRLAGFVPPMKLRDSCNRS